MPYTSEDPEVKSTRARCARVAAIVNVMWLGLANSYEIEKVENPEVSLLEDNKLTLCNRSNIWHKESNSVRETIYRSVSEKYHPISAQ